LLLDKGIKDIEKQEKFSYTGIFNQTFTPCLRHNLYRRRLSDIRKNYLSSSPSSEARCCDKFGGSGFFVRITHNFVPKKPLTVSDLSVIL